MHFIWEGVFIGNFDPKSGVFFPIIHFPVGVEKNSDVMLEELKGQSIGFVLRFDRNDIFQDDRIIEGDERIFVLDAIFSSYSRCYDHYIVPQKENAGNIFRFVFH
jgi:hypothetical protein